MYFPLGDHRGLKNPSDPGTELTSWVFMLTTRIFILGSFHKYPYMMLEPSADQFASICPRSSASISRGVPPSREINRMREGRPSVVSTYEIWLASGDHCGKATRSVDNCNLSLPSTRQRQSVPSGMLTYVAHFPSAEKLR